MVNEEEITKEKESKEKAKQESGQPKEMYVGKIGIALTAVFLIFFTVFLFYCLIQFWPETPSEESVSAVAETAPTEETPSTAEEIPAPQEKEPPVIGEVETTGEEERASTEEAATQPEKMKAQEKAKVETPEKDVYQVPKVSFFWAKIPISDEARLLVLIALGGAIGAMVRALRSFSWYVGHRKLMRSWLAMYFLLPLVGATIGLVFYLVIRGGFFSTSATIRDTSPYGFVALAALVGLFSEQAVLKLKEIAELMLKGAETGSDPVKPANGQQSGGGSEGGQGE